jgi:hypothetical protein
MFFELKVASTIGAVVDGGGDGGDVGVAQTNPNEPVHSWLCAGFAPLHLLSGAVSPCGAL